MTQRLRWRLECHETLASTSDHCIAQAEAGAAEGLAVLARTQSKARGSRGRSWSHADGNLALSVLLRPTEAGVLWPLIAGLALYAALDPPPSHALALRLKWPNDITLHGRKLGGILIEAAQHGAAPDWLVIGFGANLAVAPNLSLRDTACAAEFGPPPDARRVAERLLDSLAVWHSCCDDRERIRAAWLACAHPVGTVLAVQTPEGQITGRFSALAKDGSLELEVMGKVQRISTGDVFLMSDQHQGAALKPAGAAGPRPHFV